MYKDRKKHIDIENLYAFKVRYIWSAFKQQHLSFWFLCFYLMFEYVRPQSIYTWIDVLPYSQIFLALTIICAFADPSVKWVSSLGSKLIILFALVIVLSGIFAFRPGTSLENYVFFLNWFLMYFLVLSIVNTEVRLFLFLCAFFLFNLKMAQHGFITWAQRGFAFTTWGLTGSPGWFRNSGEFALEMLIFTPLVGVFVYSLKDKWGVYKKWAMYIIPIAGAVSIIGSSSRGGQLALVAIALWLLLRSKKKLTAILVFIVIGFTLYSFLPEEQMQRFEEMGTDKTSLQRMVYWEYGLRIMNEYPVLGVGYFNWQDYLFFIEPGGVGPMKINEMPHNIFVQAGAELGYTGFIIFLAMIASMFYMNNSTRNIARDKNALFFYLSYGLDAGLVGFLAGAFFITVLYYPFFWMQLAMVATLHSVATKKYLDVGGNKKP
jgi:putative inorganic carbon (HCO3(-)) transporter